MTELERCGKLVELFCLRPRRYRDQVVTLRLKISSKWGGWRLRSELLEGLKLDVGDTIVATVTPCYTEGLSSDVDSLDLFASGDGADWLLDNKVTKGATIDCKVRLSYEELPIAPNSKRILKVSLIFEQGIAVVEAAPELSKDTVDDSSLNDILQSLAEIKGLV